MSYLIGPCSFYIQYLRNKLLLLLVYQEPLVQNYLPYLCRSYLITLQFTTLIS